MTRTEVEEKLEQLKTLRGAFNPEGKEPFFQWICQALQILIDLMIEQDSDINDLTSDLEGKADEYEFESRIDEAETDVMDLENRVEELEKKAGVSES